MSSRSPKAAVFAGFAEVAKALGHVHRLEIIELLAQGEILEHKGLLPSEEKPNQAKQTRQDREHGRQLFALPA